MKPSRRTGWVFGSLNLLATIISVTLLSNTLPVLACSFSTDPYFTFTNHPDFPLRRYAAGSLGILQPGYARSYLLAAYRYLSNSSLTTDEQRELVGLWDSRLFPDDGTISTSDTSDWLSARKSIAKADKIEIIDTDRPISADSPFQSYCNCQTDAFRSAATTLKDLITKFSGESPLIMEWLKAQDMVFSNCGSPIWESKPKQPVIPAPLPDSSDQLLQRQRDYQIASANFYAQNFDAARKQFETISQDSKSPWQKVSGYLVVRTMIRQSTLGKTLNTNLLAQAKKKLEALSENPTYTSMKKDIDALDSYINVRLNPTEYVQKLVQEPISQRSVRDLTKSIDMLLGDKEDSSIEYAKLPSSLRLPDVVDWMLTMQSSDAAGKKHAFEKWKATKSLPWIVAAAILMDDEDANAGFLLSALEREENSPAKWTLIYNSNRLKMAQGKKEVVRIQLDKLLAAPPKDLPLSGLNQFKTQRLTLNRSLDELIRFGIQNPVSICTSGGVEQVPDDVDKLEKMTNQDHVDPLFTPELATVINTKLPLSSLNTMAGDRTIAPSLRAYLAWAAWVRAILVDDDTTARSLAVCMRPFNKSKQGLIDAYLAAPTLDGRRFAATFLMLQFSSAQPIVVSGPVPDDGYGDASGWWWSAKPVQTKNDNTNDDSNTTVAVVEPSFLTAAEKAKLQHELAKLSTLSGAPNYFAKIIFGWAKSQPNDPRVPRALHEFVKATRYGSTEDNTKVFSKQAFTLLHSRYAHTPWAKQTPYYY